MFFRRKNRTDDAAPKSVAPNTQFAAATSREPLAGTAPELVEAPVTETVAAADAAPADAVDLAKAASTSGDETVSAAVVAPRPEGDADVPATLSDDDAIRLFPGFERDDFEVGYRSDSEFPALLMRWKDGGEWFTIPGLFNRGILSAMDERESASDLNRLLRNYGYDIDAINE